MREDDDVFYPDDDVIKACILLSGPTVQNRTSLAVRSRYKETADIVRVDLFAASALRNSSHREENSPHGISRALWTHVYISAYQQCWNKSPTNWYHELGSPTTLTVHGCVVPTEETKS